MPEFLAFRGLRYAPGTDETAVIAPPYDVIDEADRVRLERRHANNAVRLILPDPLAADPYAAAAADLAAWRAAGVLRTDPRAHLYPYRMDFTDETGRARSTMGVLGALTLPDASGGEGVLPHERTLPKAKSDRLALLRATAANLDPIWALSPATGLTALLVADGAPAAHGVDDQGVRHSLWVLDDPDRAAAVTAAIAAQPLVLADGHHRFETAMARRDELVADGRALDGAEAVMAFVTELADDQLRVQPIHRLVWGLPNGARLRDRLRDSFDLVDVPDAVASPESVFARMDAQGAMALVDGDGAALLVARPGVAERAMADEEPVLADLDAARFEALVAPVITDADIAYRAGRTVADEGRRPGHAAILLRAPTVAQIRAAAFAGVRMPQKTSYFAPKPRTGMVFRAFDDAIT